MFLVLRPPTAPTIISALTLATSGVPAESRNCGAWRQGPWMYYRIVEPSDADAARVLKDVLVWLANDREMQRDRERLVKVCCAPQLPIRIQGAPRPATLTANVWRVESCN